MSDNNFISNETVEWDYLLHTLEEKKCFLFLGPDSYTPDNGLPIEDALCKHLDAIDPNHPYIKKYYSQDGFFLFREKRFKNKIIFQIRKFYEQEFLNTKTLFKKIAAIPFHVVFNLGSDDLLSKVYNNFGIEHHFSFFHKNNPSRKLTNLVNGLPIVYNLLGHLNEDESLVLTHDDFYDYLKSIMQRVNLKDEVITEIINAKNFIILGMPFEKWYMQLLMRILSLHLSSSSFDRLAPIHSLEDQLKYLYQEEFKINFISNNIKDFIDKLYSQCEAKGILRSIGSSISDTTAETTIDLEELKELVGTNKTQKGLLQLKTYLSRRKMVGSQYYDEITILMNRQKSLESNNNLKLITTEEYAVENLKLNYSFLNLINKIDTIKT